jgi:hypothetical protein
VAKIGRPRRKPPADAADRLETLAAAGHATAGIAKALGVSSSVLTHWMTTRPTLREAFERGREAERLALHTRLRELAANGDKIACIFLLKARHGYREGEPVEIANNVRVSFTLPGAMTLEQFKTVTNATDPATEPVPAKAALPAPRG